jgi:hypothetical protein
MKGTRGRIWTRLGKRDADEAEEQNKGALPYPETRDRRGITIDVRMIGTRTKRAVKDSF